MVFSFDGVVRGRTGDNLQKERTSNPTRDRPGTSFAKLAETGCMQSVRNTKLIRLANNQSTESRFRMKTQIFDMFKYAENTKKSEAVVNQGLRKRIRFNIQLILFQLHID